METWESITLGILQGVTEFLPVSSSGHLSIFEYFLGLEETPRFFDVMLHVEHSWPCSSSIGSLHLKSGKGRERDHFPRKRAW